MPDLLGLAPQALDEVSPTEDPGIARDGFLRAPEGHQFGPAPALRTRPPPWNSGRRPCGSPSATKVRYGPRARRGLGPNWARIIAVACHGLGMVPRRALCPVQG